MGQEKVWSWIFTEIWYYSLLWPSLTCFCFAACFLQFECHHKPHQAWPEYVVPCLQDLQQEGDWSFWIWILVWGMPKERLWMLTEVKFVSRSLLLLSIWCQIWLFPCILQIHHGPQGLWSHWWGMGVRVQWACREDAIFLVVREGLAPEMFPSQGFWPVVTLSPAWSAVTRCFANVVSFKTKSPRWSIGWY